MTCKLTQELMLMDVFSESLCDQSLTRVSEGTRLYHEICVPRTGAREESEERIFGVIAFGKKFFENFLRKKNSWKIGIWKNGSRKNFHSENRTPENMSWNHSINLLVSEFMISKINFHSKHL